MITELLDNNDDNNNDNDQYIFSPRDCLSPSIYHKKNVFDYDKLIEDSKVCESTDSVSLILALRYGKGVELLKAELCLSEAKRLYTSKEYSSEINKNRNKNIDSIYISSTSPNMSRRKYYIDSNNNNTDNKPKINETKSEIKIP